MRRGDGAIIALSRFSRFTAAAVAREREYNLIRGGGGAARERGPAYSVTCGDASRARARGLPLMGMGNGSARSVWPAGRICGQMR